MKFKYDIFLSHNSVDKDAVKFIATKLARNKLIPFFDIWNLVPGAPWQEDLEKALIDSKTVGIFIGPSGLGGWHNEEMRAALERRVKNPSFRVIPILLPGALKPGSKDIPLFLGRLAWVDFRGGLRDKIAFARLLSGISGNPPGPM